MGLPSARLRTRRGRITKVTLVVPTIPAKRLHLCLEPGSVNAFSVDSAVYIKDGRNAGSVAGFGLCWELTRMLT